MKTIIFKAMLCMTLVELCLAGNLLAQQALGADISYECLGNSKYEITLTLQRDCSGGPVPLPAPTIVVQSTLCGRSYSLTPKLKLGYPQPLESPLAACASVQPGSCVSQYQFWDTLRLRACSDWEILASTAPGRGSIDNVNNAANISQGIRARLNTEDALCGHEFCNTSPSFFGSATQTVCANTSQEVYLGTTEIEGDSLVYSLIHMIDSAGANVNFASPYNATEPLPSNPLISMNGTDAVLYLQPIRTGLFTLAVQVEEYRLGKFIGSVSRELCIKVVNCSVTKSPPTIYPPEDFGANGTCQAGGYAPPAMLGTENKLFHSDIFLCPHDEDSFYFSFDAKSFQVGDSLFMNDSLVPDWLYINPLYATAAGDSIHIEVRESGSGAYPSGIYSMAFYFYHKDCPIRVHAIYTVNLYVGLDRPGGLYGGYRAVGFPMSMGSSDPNDIRWGPITASPGPVYTVGDTPLVLSANVVNNSCSAYVLDTIPYAPVLIDSSQGMDIALEANTVSNLLPLGFDMRFLCKSYSGFYVSSAGWLSFDDPGGQVYPGAQALPSRSQPGNLIAFLWNNLSVDTAVASSYLNYTVIDTFPHRKGVLSLKNAISLDNGSPNNSVQLIMNELSGELELHITRIDSDTFSTLGIEDSLGGAGLGIPQKNKKLVKTGIGEEEAWRFSPVRVQYVVEWIHAVNIDQNNQPIRVDTLMGYGDQIRFKPSSESIITAVLHRPPGPLFLGGISGPYYLCCGLGGGKSRTDSLHFRVYVDYPPLIQDSTEELSFSQPINDFRLYPNPAAQSVFIENNSTQAATANIFDLQGRMCLKQVLPAETKSVLNVETLAGGIYLVNIQTAKGIISRKIIVNR